MIISLSLSTIQLTCIYNPEVNHEENFRNQKFLTIELYFDFDAYQLYMQPLAIHVLIIDILTPGTGLETKQCAHRSYRYTPCLLNAWTFTSYFYCVLRLVFYFLVSYLVITL